VSCKYEKCPICEGRGIVPGGFYSSLPGCSGVTASVTEYCRTCNGRGIMPMVEIVGMNSVTYPNGFPPAKILLNIKSDKEINLEQQIAAANEEIARLKQGCGCGCKNETDIR
jgi:hypothetical protein